MMSEDISQALQHQIGQYQQLQQQAQLVIMQRQNMDMQLKELENAIKELEGASDDVSMYKSIGALFIHAKKDTTLSELKETKESLEIRVASLGKQEKTLTDKLKEMEQKITQKMNLGKSNTPHAG